MTYRFVRQWRGYQLGRVIDGDHCDLMRGQIDLLARRHILVPCSQTVEVGTKTTAYTAMDAQPQVVMSNTPRRRRPLGSKNRPKG